MSAILPDLDVSGRPSGRFDRSVSLLTWGYNEREIVESFLDRAFALLEQNVIDYELVFIDDGSTDGTGEIVARYAEKEPRLRLITNERNFNVGISCRHAIAAARKEYLFWQTVDWAYDLTNLRIFLELLRHFDVVQGIRPTPIRLLSYIPVLRSIYRVKSRSDSLPKALISLANYYALRVLFNAPFHDVQNTTIYPTKLIQSVDLRGDSSFINPECLLKTLATGASFIEVPVRFLPREAGEAKGTTPMALLRSIRDILVHWFAWGWRLRFGSAASQVKIRRVAEPIFLDEDVLRLILPLFKEFR